MAAKNIQILKKQVFSLLKNDVTLTNLLGGSGHILHKQPNKNAVYPCVIYAVINDSDFPYNEDSGESDVTTSFIRITVFSKNSGTEQVDNIEYRVKQLLHGQRALDSSEIICYSCYRENMTEPIRDPDDTTWIQTSRYRTSWALK
jgi:hypothetical protein